MKQMPQGPKTDQFYRLLVALADEQRREDEAKARAMESSRTAQEAQTQAPQS